MEDRLSSAGIGEICLSGNTSAALSESGLVLRRSDTKHTETLLSQGPYTLYIQNNTIKCF